jgi:hypothetical protein
MSGRKQDAAPAGSEKEKAKREDVVLVKDHDHGGKPCKAGSTISVLPHQKAWLQQLGKIAKPGEGEGK